MPDQHKFETLRAAGYHIPGLCALCAHGEFPSSGPWGTCALHRYEHGKHTGAPRGVSVHRMGACPSFQELAARVAALALGAHEEFLPGRCPQPLPPSAGKKPRR